MSLHHFYNVIQESLGILTDFSKYGTFVNNIKVNREANLKHNDLIQFGQSQHKFRCVSFLLCFLIIHFYVLDIYAKFVKYTDLH